MRCQKCQTTNAHMAVLTIKSTAASGPVMSLSIAIPYNFDLAKMLAHSAAVLPP
jgi:hypothetical protein